MVHSAATVARPRSRNLRALCCSLMIPKTGSTSCFLSRYASLAANVVLQARWRRSTPSWRPIARLRPGSRTDSEGRARLADQTATEDEPFSYTVPAFTDPDDDALTYAAAQSNDGSLPGWLSFNTEHSYPQRHARGGRHSGHPHHKHHRERRDGIDQRYVGLGVANLSTLICLARDRACQRS